MARIKLFGIIPKKPGISSEEFHDHYRHPHGTMACNVSTLRSYFQNHQIHSDLLDNNQNQYEAVAELWVDNLADVLSFREEPVVVNDMIADEQLFVDVNKLKFLAADEEVLTSTPDARDQKYSKGDVLWSPFTRPLSVKILQFIETDGNQGWATDKDLSLGDAIGAFRHVRCHSLATVHGDQLPFLGVRELWWPTMWSFKQGVAVAPDAFTQLLSFGGKSITMLAQSERWL